jgi:hypothetical protein
MVIAAEASARPLLRMTLIESAWPLVKIAGVVARRAVVLRTIGGRTGVVLAIDPSTVSALVVDGRAAVGAICGGTVAAGIVD